MAKLTESPDYSQLTTVELAYIAGLIDGEGCLRWYKSNQKQGRYKPYPSLQITSTHRGVLEWLVEKVSGSYIETKRIKPSSKKCQPCFNWVLHRMLSLYQLLILVYPYLIIKKERALKVIEYIRTTWPKETE